MLLLYIGILLLFVALVEGVVCFVLFTYVGVYPWELWQTCQHLVACIEPVLLDHVYPRHIIQHKQAEYYWYKSKFCVDMSEEQVRDAIVDGIAYPTYEFTAYNIKDSGIKGYEIYKRLSILYLMSEYY